MPRKNAKLEALRPLTPERYLSIMGKLYPRDLHKEVFMHGLDPSDTLYRWWYEFAKAAKASPAVLEELSADPEKATAIATTLEKFGDFKEDFVSWWAAGGSAVFQEKGVPIVEVLNHAKDKEQSRRDVGLVVRIPLNISRELILEQLNVLLEIYHPKETLRRHEYSTAELKLHPHPKKVKADFDRLLKLWRDVNLEKSKGKTYNYWRAYCAYIGEGELLQQLNEENNDDMPTIHDLERLGIRAYKTADSYIRNAIIGVFPKDE